MTVVNIYKLEDNEENNVVSSLREGEHVIGRGDLLKCNDKKVSRKHAVIKVDEGGASITAVHINPCFYRPCGGSIRVLLQNQTVPLSNEDQFALLPTTFWFKVKLVIENDRLNENSSFESKNACQDDMVSPKSLSTEVHGDTTTSNNEGISSKTLSTEVEGDTTTSNKRSHEDDDEVNKKLKVSSSGEEDERNVSRGSRSSSCSLEGLLNESLNESYCNAVTQQILDTPQSNADKIVVVSDDEDNDREQNVKVKEELSLQPNIKEEPSSQPDVKKEPSSQSDVKTEPSTSVEETSNNCDNKDNTGNGEPSNDNQNNPSSSTNTGNNPNPSIRRDRCWYGESCYRKNAQHRADFAHPGDQDYVSDPNDDRPVCPFGIGCYRTNFAHRRQYRHEGRPAPKPIAPNIAPQTPKKRKPKQKKKDESNDEDDLSNEGSDRSDDDGTGQTGNIGRKKRKAALKKKKYTDTPEDDYDYNDPFLDDGSSDEFVISSDDEDDTDWVDSQEMDEESKETKRMLKEAKRFTKGKGKK